MLPRKRETNNSQKNDTKVAVSPANLSTASTNSQNPSGKVSNKREVCPFIPQPSKYPPHSPFPAFPLSPSRTHKKTADAGYHGFMMGYGYYWMIWRCEYEYYMYGIPIKGGDMTRWIPHPSARKKTTRVSTQKLVNGRVENIRNRGIKKGPSPALFWSVQFIKIWRD